MIRIPRLRESNRYAWYNCPDSDYNRADVLPRAIESVLDQTIDDFELIIIDDGSVDNTPSVVENYANENPRIRYIAHDQNRGAITALNTGFDAADGTYVTTSVHEHVQAFM